MAPAARRGAIGLDGVVHSTWVRVGRNVRRVARGRHPTARELRSIRGWELDEHLPIRLHPSIKDPRLASERASQATWATESMLRRLVSRRIDDHLLGIWGNPMAVRTEFTRWSGPCSRSRPIVTDPSVAETLAVLTFGRRSMARAAFIAQSAQSMERTPIELRGPLPGEEPGPNRHPAGPHPEPALHWESTRRPPTTAMPHPT